MKTIRKETDKANLIERIEKLKGDETAIWGKMSVNQMMSHVVQAGRLPFEASLPDRSTFASRKIIKPLVLYVLTMPKEVKTSPEMNQQENGRRPQEFDVDRKLVVDSINKLAELTLDHECFYHPFFGKMTAKQWGILAHKHVDHHLRQFGA